MPLTSNLTPTILSGLWVAMKISQGRRTQHDIPASHFVLFPTLSASSFTCISFQHASFLMKPCLYIVFCPMCWHLKECVHNIRPNPHVLQKRDLWVLRNVLWYSCSWNIFHLSINFLILTVDLAHFKGAQIADWIFGYCLAEGQYSIITNIGLNLTEGCPTNSSRHL